MDIRFYVWWTLLLLSTSNAENTNNVQFVFQHRFYASYSTWVLNFHFDLLPFNKQIHDLETSIELLRKSVSVLTTPNVQNQKLLKFTDLNRNLQDVLSKECDQLSTHFKKMNNTFQNFKFQVTKVPKSRRSKRSLLPLGGIMSFLFGTASEETVDRIKTAVNSLRSSQEKIIHVLDHGLTVLNTTVKNVELNRNSINLLINSTNTLSKWISDIYKKITEGLEPEIQFIQINQQLSGVFHLIYSTFHTLQRSITLLHSQVMEAIQGHLTSALISNVQLYSALAEVQQQIPATLELPIPLVNLNLRKYYEILRVTLIPDENSFHIMIILPLIQKSSIFELYKIIHIPAYVNSNTTLSYHVTHPFMAISPDRNVYMLLNDRDVSLCHSTDFSFCSMSQPIMSANFAPSCIPSLFLHIEKFIKSTCHFTLSSLPQSPIVKGLTKRNWLIFSKTKMSLDLVCFDYSKNSLHNLEIKVGVNIITMPVGCSGHTPAFTLPHYLQEESRYTVRQSSHSLANITKYLYNISNTPPKGHPSGPIATSFNVLPKLRSQEKDMQKLLGEIQQIKYSDPMRNNPFTMKAHWIYYFLFSIIIVFSLVVVTYCLYKRCFHKRLANHNVSDRLNTTHSAHHKTIYTQIQPVPKKRQLEEYGPTAPQLPSRKTVYVEVDDDEEPTTTFTRTIDLIT